MSTDLHPIQRDESGPYAGVVTVSLDAPGKSVSRSFAGRYTTDGTEFILTWQGAGGTRVTIDGGTLTMKNEGMLFVYEK